MGPITQYLFPASAENNIKELQNILWETSPEAFTQNFEINVTAVYYTTVAFLELLDKGNKHGGIRGVTSQVITTSSAVGVRRDGGPVGVPYTTSKAGPLHLGKVLSSLLKDYQIRSNIVVPGIYSSGAFYSFYIGKVSNLLFAYDEQK